jgi:hypothetical protein
VRRSTGVRIEGHRSSQVSRSSRSTGLLQDSWDETSPENSARREKVPCHLRVGVPPGELSVDPSSYRGGEEGNRIAEALGTEAHLGWVCKPTGRNMSEARAGLEREVVSADLPEFQGRPMDRMGATDR